MKIGVISDVHANLIALEQCLHYLEEQAEAEAIFFLGDAVGYYPDAPAVIDLLIGRNIYCLAGNHEAMLLGYQALDQQKEELYRLMACKKQLNRQQHDFLSSLVPFMQTELDNRHLLFVHGSPYNPMNGYVYPDTDTVPFGRLPYDIIFMGHTHRPFIKKQGNKLLVNVGSCGLPRDAGQLSSFAVYDTGSGEAEIIRLPIDIERIKKQYAASVHASVIDTLHRSGDHSVIGSIIS